MTFFFLRNAAAIFLLSAVRRGGGCVCVRVGGCVNAFLASSHLHTKLDI